jgi:hypothetical protein
MVLPSWHSSALFTKGKVAPTIAAKAEYTLIQF